MTVGLFSVNNMLERITEVEEEQYGYDDGDSLRKKWMALTFLIFIHYSVGVFFVNGRIKLELH